MEKWSKLELQDSVKFSAGYATHSPEEPASDRQVIIETYNWEITDGGVTEHPAITTDAMTKIDSNQAISGGNIQFIGGSDIISKGIVWDTTHYPTITTFIDSSHNGNGVGTFTVLLDSLTTGTKYYVRAYATNSQGTAYGNQQVLIPQYNLYLIGDYSVKNKAYDHHIIATIDTNNIKLEGVKTAHDSVGLGNLVLNFDNKDVDENKPVIIRKAQLVGADSLKYKIIYDNLPTSQANIYPKPVSVVNLTVGDKIYDGSDSAIISNLKLKGVVGRDDILITDSSGFFDDKNVGESKPITTLITLSGSDTINYELIQPTALIANILPKPISLSGDFSVEEKIYDGSSAATLLENNLNLEGVISTDDIELDEVLASFSHAEVGEDIIVNLDEVSIKGVDVNNYALSLEEAPTSLGNIIVVSSIYNGNEVEIEVYPNPINNYMHISTNKTIEKITLSNLSGQVLMRKNEILDTRISTAALPLGIYYLTIHLSSGEHKTLKVIKN